MRAALATRSSLSTSLPQRSAIMDYATLHGPGISNFDSFPSQRTSPSLLWTLISVFLTTGARSVADGLGGASVARSQVLGEKMHRDGFEGAR
jgi:hypothetical protein